MLSFQEEDNLKTISIEQTQAVHHFNYNKPLKSSVRLAMVNDNKLEIGHASGNYFKVGGHHFILTAAHAVGDGEFMVYVEDGAAMIPIEVVHYDEEKDLAIVVPTFKLFTKKPVDYRINNKSDIRGETVVHAGYPADFELSVFNGTVSICYESNFMMQSFALPGSSGSVVFDNNGRVVGVLSALKMGYYGHSPFPQLHPTMVYVTRTRELSRKNIREMIVKWNSSK
tara:strand:- start:2 stop:679 length:678 start_codon:yes stop_codon:yes gene_type:complete